MIQIKINREQFLEFVRDKNEDAENVSPKYFLKYFDSYEKTGQKVSWNWAAFFFMHIWFLYRKMYFYTALLLFCDLGLILGIYFLFGKEGCAVSEISSNILFRLILLRYANYSYLIYANKKVKEGIFNKGTNRWVVGFLFALFIIALIPSPIRTIIISRLLEISQFG